MAWTHELAWAAGFFDGEGSVVLHRQGDKTPSITLSISQSGDTETLERFRRAVGMGVVRGPYFTPKNTRKPIYQFMAYGYEKVQAVVAMLWPWLSSTKREQAATRLIELRNRQHDLYLKGLMCSKGHLWGGIAGQRGATFSVDVRGTKVCRICVRESSRQRNDINRQRVYVPRPSRRKEVA